jgi:hypothetical protein
MAIRIDGDNATATPGITGGDADTGLVFGTDEIEAVTGGTTRFTVESNGNCTIEDGNLVVASGHGIDFSATADGSGTVTSELLDDYEEGTWTPVLGVTDGNSTHTQTSQQGFYVKVGRKVTVWGRAAIDTLGNNGNGVCSMNGLPFNSRTSASVIGGPAIVFSEGFDTNYVPQGTQINTNSDKLTFRGFGGTDRERITFTLGPGRYTSSSEIMIQGSYYTD